MASLWSELRRRNVIRVGAAYLAAAWLLLQVADMILANFSAPPWIIQALIFAAALAFPFVLLLAWYYDLTPEGITPEEEVAPKASTPFTGRKIDFVIIGALVLAVGFLLARDYLVDNTAKQSTSSDPSIAVLPFVNQSSDPEQEYFSAGVSEEILNLLSRVPNFKVISRTSAFFYRGDNVDLQTVADELNVDHVLEGSVRRAGNEVRVNVQLVEARTDRQIWSATYDHTLDDIFAVQEEIAINVLEQMQVTLLGEAPAVDKTTGEAYALFLRARHIINQGLVDNFPQAEDLLLQSLAIDPNYVTALSELIRLYVNQIPRGQKTEEEGYRLARGLLGRIEASEPAHPAVPGWKSWLAQRADNDMATTAHYLEIAMAMNPTSLDMLRGAIELVKWLGRPDESIILGEYLISRDPTCTPCYRTLAETYRDARRYEEAEHTISTGIALRPTNSTFYEILGEIQLLNNMPEAALNSYRQMPEDDPRRHAGVTLALHDLGRVEDAQTSQRGVLESRSNFTALAAAKMYAYFGDTESAFEWLERAIESGNSRLLTAAGFNPLFENLHSDPRWEEYLEQRGVSAAQVAAMDFQVTLPE